MSKQGKLLIVLLYVFFAMVMLSPLSSDRYIPGGDCITHLSFMIQARDALMQWQFPIRVAPITHAGFGYPLYQFYSPFPNTIAGLLLLLSKTHNPFIIYKLLLRVAFVLGGIYMFRLCKLLTGSIPASILAGVAYLISPYLLINATMRHDFTESFAQGILPIILFYTFMLYKNISRKNFIICTLCWSMLILAHLLTFAYTAVFVLLLFLLHCRADQPPQWPRFFYIVLVIGFAVILCSWFVAPVALFGTHLFIHNAITNPYTYSWLTPLANLLSLTSVSPMPLPGNGLLTNQLYPAVGYPILMMVGIVIYTSLTNKALLEENKWGVPLILCFCVALFVTWSPINFWNWMPAFFVILQFSYRLLTQVMWLGTLLFAFSLSWLFRNKCDEFTFLTILVVIVIGNSAWLHTVHSNQDYDTYSTVAAAIRFSEHVWNNDYLIQPNSLTLEERLVTANPKPITTCHHEKSILLCEATVDKSNPVVILPQLYYPKMLSIKIAQQAIPYYAVVNGENVYAALKLPAGNYQIQAQFVGLTWANWLSAIAWLSLLASVLWLGWSRITHKKT